MDFLSFIFSVGFFYPAFSHGDPEPESRLPGFGSTPTAVKWPGSRRTAKFGRGENRADFPHGCCDV